MVLKKHTTQDLYQKAIKFAGEKHANQTVPGTNSNYLLHISNVTMEVLLAYNNKPNFDIDLAIQVAILHDTIEDTDADFNHIKNQFSETVAIAVQALTKDDMLLSKREKMIDSLNRISQLSKEVGIVKLADRITNLQSPPKHWSLEKISNYLEEAKLILSSLKTKNEYLAKRLELKINDYKAYIS